MADTVTGKKGKKKKGKTVNLTEFLSGGGGGTVSSFATKKAIDIEENEPAPNDDWEDELPKKEVFDLSRLPTAPRASRDTVDAKKLPTQPPYTAFLGNLAYDVEDEDIHTFFANLKLEKVRLPRENGRLRGFGYAEFCDVESLAEAIKLNNESLKGRNIRVDIADHSGSGDGSRQDESREDRSTDWRKREPGETRSFDRPRDGMGRSDRREERNYVDADSVSTWRRSSPLEPSMPDQPRNQAMHNQRNQPQGESEADTASSWRKAPSDSADDRRGFNDERSGYERERGSYERERGGYERGYDSRGGYDSRDGFERGRGGFDSREKGGYDRGRAGYDRERGGYDRGRYERESETTSSWRNDSPSMGERESSDSLRRDMVRPDREIDRGQSQGVPKERPKLNLKPRTVDTPKQETGTNTSSIFGGARPVDTATKEKQIEQRLIQEKEKDHRDHRSSHDHPGAKRREKEENEEDELLDDKDSQDSSIDYHMKKDKTRVMRPDFSSPDSIPQTTENSSDNKAPSLNKDRKDSNKKGNSPAPHSYEEPKAPVFVQKSVFSVLANDDDEDAVDSGNEED